MRTLPFMLPCGRRLLCNPEGLGYSHHEHWGRSHSLVRHEHIGISSSDHGSSTAESFRPSIVRNVFGNRSYCRGTAWRVNLSHRARSFAVGLALYFLSHQTRPTGVQHNLFPTTLYVEDHIVLYTSSSDRATTPNTTS